MVTFALQFPPRCTRAQSAIPKPTAVKKIATPADTVESGRNRQPNRPIRSGEDKRNTKAIVSVAKVAARDCRDCRRAVRLEVMPQATQIAKKTAQEVVIQ